MLLEGHQLGRYRVIRQVGSGGMGTIFLAKDTQMPRQVAVKVIRTGDDMSQSPEAAQRLLRGFQREMRAIVQLDHPHILPVFDFGQQGVEEATYTYLVMLYRPEGSLADWIRQPANASRLSLDAAARLLMQAAQALQHVHTRGIIHQDVKPSNFLVRADAARPEALPDLLLADFGIARFSGATTTHSQSYQVGGTPMFMGPEQWEGQPGPASDQYALAIMAFWLLTGRFPFEGAVGQVMRHHYMTPPPAPSSFHQHLTATIDAVILRALAKEPEQRFPDIQAFAHAFSQAVYESDIPHLALITVHTSLTAAPAVAPTITPNNPTPDAHVEPLGRDASVVPFKQNKLVATVDNDVTPGEISDPASAAVTFKKPVRSDDVNPAATIAPMQPIAPLAPTSLTPATPTPSTFLHALLPTPVGSRRYTRLQKGVAVALLALIILVSVGAAFYRNPVTSQRNSTQAQHDTGAQIIHTPTGTITVTVRTTATQTGSQPSILTTGSTPLPGSTPVTGPDPQTTATPGSTPGSSVQPTATPTPLATLDPSPLPTAQPTTAPPGPTTVPPAPTPVPGCTVRPWSLSLRAQSNGGSVFTVTNYCNRTVWLSLTQAPAYTTDLQICFGLSHCTGWNSAPSYNIGVFIEFNSGLSLGEGFTINARCHGGGSCPATYTIYGNVKY